MKKKFYKIKLMKDGTSKMSNGAAFDNLKLLSPISEDDVWDMMKMFSFPPKLVKKGSVGAEEKKCVNR